MATGGGLRLVTARTVLDEVKEHIVMAHALSCCTGAGDEANNKRWANTRGAWASDELEAALELLEKIQVQDDGPKLA